METKDVLHTDDEITDAMLILLRMREKCEDDGESTEEEKRKAINLALHALSKLPVSN